MQVFYALVCLGAIIMVQLSVAITMFRSIYSGYI